MPIFTHTRHGQLAAKVLHEVEIELRTRGQSGRRDDWPFHITALGNPNVSIWCGGFDKHIEVHPLCKNGEPDLRYTERSFMTPKGATNYVIKFFEKRSTL